MGNGFAITKVYPSTAAMFSDFSGIDTKRNDFVLINSTDADNGKLYVKTATTFAFQSQLAGVKGDRGEQGLQGQQGLQGADGRDGAKGDKGDKGDTGDRGPRGIQGEQGIAGPQGIQGPKGEVGRIRVLGTLTGTSKDDAESKLPVTAQVNDAYWIDTPDYRALYIWTADPSVIAVPDWLIGPNLRGSQGSQGIQGPQGIQGTKGDKGDKGDSAVVVQTGTVTISSALSSRSGRISDVVLQKQGIFNRLSMSFYNGDTTQQAAGSRLTIGTIPAEFRPSKVVHTFATDNGSSNYPRHAVLIDTNGNIIWIPQNATGYFTMNFSVVY